MKNTVGLLLLTPRFSNLLNVIECVVVLPMLIKVSGVRKLMWTIKIGKHSKRRTSTNFLYKT